MNGVFDLSSYLKISGSQAALRREEARKEGIHAPAFLQADIASRCNMHCLKSCTYTEHFDRLLSAAEWDSLFLEMEQLGVRFVFLGGGEPLLEREILERAARYKDMWFLVFTNGTLLDEQYYRFFSNHRNMVPILGLEICANNNLSKTGKSSYMYESLMYSMDELSRRDIVYGACVFLTKGNRNRVATRGFLEGMNRRKCNGVIYLERERREGDALLDPEERDALEEELKEIQKEFQEMLLYLIPRDGKITGITLEKAEEVLRITVDGYLCPTVTSAYKAGDLKKKRLRELLKDIPV